eukprot:g21115.t1
MQSGDALQVLAVAEQFARSARLLSARPLRLGVRRTRTCLLGGPGPPPSFAICQGRAGAPRKRRQKNGRRGRRGLCLVGAQGRRRRRRKDTDRQVWTSTMGKWAEQDRPATR